MCSDNIFLLSGKKKLIFTSSILPVFQSVHYTITLLTSWSKSVLFIHRVEQSTGGLSQDEPSVYFKADQFT